MLVLSPETLVDNVHFGVAPTWKDFVLAIPIGMLAYTGIETISNMSEEARDGPKTIPAAINRVRVAVFAIYFTLPAVALSALPVEAARGRASTSRCSGARRRRAASPATRSSASSSRSISGRCSRRASCTSALLAATILFLATNAALIGVSRLVYSMGIHRQLPDGLRRLHPRFRTPWIGILVFSAAAIVTLLPGQEDFLGYMYSFGAMLSFTIAHVAVMRLRATEPDFPRPYRGPGNITVRGYDLPLFAVFGALGTSIAFVVTVVLHPEVAAAGFGWLVLGIAIYIVFRRRHGLDMSSTYKVAIPQPVVDHEAEYDSVLVPLIDGRFDEHVLGTATKLAARKRRGIHVLSLVTVPSALPISAPMSEEIAQAESAIEQARVHGGRRVSGHSERIRAGQAGRRIIEEAQDMRAAAIVMALPPRVAGGSLFGRTLETVLAERPCRVIIETNGDSPR